MIPSADLNSAIIYGVLGNRRHNHTTTKSPKAEITYDEMVFSNITIGATPFSSSVVNREEDESSESVFQENTYSATVGIFFINPLIQHNYDAFYQYLTDFDRKSGARMDFFLPGFRKKNDKWISSEEFTDDYEKQIRFKNEIYYFSKSIYDDMAAFIEGQIPGVEIQNNLDPKLLIVDITIDRINRTIKYDDYFLIDLKEDDIEKNYLYILIDFFSDCAEKELCGRYRKFRYYSQIKAKNLLVNAKKALPNVALNIVTNIMTNNMLV